MTDTNATADGKGEALTPAQQLELEQARASRAASEVRAAELETERARLDAQNVQLRFESNFAEGIRESNCDFYMDAKGLRKLLELEAGLEIQPAADGRVHCTRDGQRVAFKDVLREFGTRNPYLLKNPDSVLSDAALVEGRDQLVTREQKMAFISKNGSAAYERLPQHGASKIDVNRITASEWRALDPQAKVRLIGQGASVDKIMARR